ncbi:anti-sigma factor antagonist [Streptomyces sp. NPDC047123]|uniref:anti-sigma factor antagonist n=1 Tax=Streptomyces sp. NPDC047123 TaxID=3155622 RepID=UPI003400255E
MPEPAFPRSSPASVQVGPVSAGVRTCVALRGEIDLNAAHRLRPELYTALGRSTGGLELDVSEVEFCDCSGLNLLLRLHQQAVAQGKTITIAVSSPAVRRLLELTGTRGLFGPVAASANGTRPVDGADAQCPVVHELSRSEESGEDLRAVVFQLERAMATRPTIDLARGILMSSFGLSPEAAWEVLVATSQNTNTKLHLLAGDVVGTVGGSALPDLIRTQLEAAISRSNRTRRAAPAAEP